MASSSFQLGSWSPGTPEQQSRKVKKSVHHNAWQNKLQNADRIASTILATLFSAHRSQAPVNQSKIGFDCCAVGVFSSGLTQGAGTLYVAMNGVTVNHISQQQVALSICNLIKTEGCFTPSIQPISINPEKMHAEMQILQYLSDKNINVPQAGLIVGVSKPCCLMCAQILSASKVQYSLYHTDKVENWEAPNLHWLK